MFKIVAAVDRSRYASVVMDTVSKVTSHIECDVTILTAIKPKRSHATESAGEDEGAVAEFHEELIRKYFPHSPLALGSRSNRDPLIISTQGATVHSRILEGAPADVICSLAEAVDADLVVVGKRGRGNLDAMLLGSVTEKVVQKCTRSVLVAKREGTHHGNRGDHGLDVESKSHTVSN